MMIDGEERNSIEGSNEVEENEEKDEGCTNFIMLPGAYSTWYSLG